MADYGVWQRTIVDSFGRRVAFAEISVIDSLTGQPAELFADVGGTVPLDNPFDANAEGFARFFTHAGYYDITVSGTGSALTWVREPLGVPDRPLVRAPQITAPTEGQTQVNLNFELSGSAFTPLYSGDERLHRQFQAVVAGGSFDAPDFSVTENADSAIIGQVPPNTQIQARMRDVSTRGDESRWSEIVTFTSTDQFVEKPVNVSPAAGAVDQFPQPTLQADEFATAGVPDVHLSSTFRVYETATGALVYTGEQTTGDLTQHTVTTALDINAEFEWEVVYVGEELGPSEPSERTAFTTQAALPVAVNSTPAAGAVDVYPGATLEIEPLDAQWNHESTQWRALRVSDGTVIHDSGVSTTALTSYTLPNDIFEPEVEYEWQAQVKIAGFDASEWSTPTAYTTVAAPVPVLVAPLDGETELGATPALALAPISSPFTQTGSQWKAYRDSDGVLVHDSGETTELSSYTLPIGIVDASTAYRWEARARTDEYGWGAWTSQLVFTTRGTFPPSTIVSGTPAPAGRVNSIFVDENHIFLGHSGGGRLTILNTNSLSVVSGTPSLPATVNGVFADSEYLYVAWNNRNGGDGFTIFQRSNWSEVPISFSLPDGTQGRGVWGNSTYVVIAHDRDNLGGRLTGFTILNRSDFSVVSGVPTIFTNIYGVDGDDDYVYLAVRGGNGFAKLSLTDLSLVSGTPSVPTSNAVYADEENIYLAPGSGWGGDPISIIDKVTNNIIPGTPVLPNNGYGIHGDDSFIYLAYALGSSALMAIDKADFSEVSGLPVVETNGWSVMTYQGRVYLGIEIAPYFVVME